MNHLDALTLTLLAAPIGALTVWAWYAHIKIGILEAENKALHEEVCRLAINNSLG